MDGLIDAVNDFSASKLFDCSKVDTKEQIEETSFCGALSLYASCNPTKCVQIESLLDMRVAENTMKNLNLEREKQRNTGLINKAKTPNFVQENQEIGKQKLEGGKTRLNHQLRPQMETPKIPLVHTSVRALPAKIRSSKKLEKEQEKAPKFKARPLNKTILESKGELGLFCNKKRQVTIPQEFHFAIDKRISAPRTTNTAELFNKITLCLKSHSKKPIPRNTIPRPFHFRTEERGTRIPKSNPLPCTTYNHVMEEGNALKQVRRKTLISHAR